MDTKGKVAYILMCIGFIGVLISLMMLGNSIEVLGISGLMCLFIIVGALIYSTGYVKRIVVKEIKNIQLGEDEGLQLVDPYRIYDEEGNEYKCSVMLQDVFVVGEYYMVRISYDGTIMNICG